MVMRVGGNDLYICVLNLLFLDMLASEHWGLRKKKKKNPPYILPFPSLGSSCAGTTPDALPAPAQQLVVEWIPLPLERVGEAHLLVTRVTVGRCISLLGLP